MVTEQDLNDAPTVPLSIFCSRQFEQGFWLDDGYYHVPILKFECPLGVTDNACHRYSKSGGSYASQEYKAWLNHCAPLLQDLLGDWQPDTTRWWSVHLDLWIGNTDGPNHTKALLDLLSGARVVTEAFSAKNGKRIGKGSVWNYGGLWDDDKRVAVVHVNVVATRHPTPYAQVTAWETTPPVDYRAEQEAQAKQQRQNERQAAQEVRQQVREAERERKANEVAARTRVETVAAWLNILLSMQGQPLASARKRVREAVGDQPRYKAIAVTFTPGEWAKLNGGTE